MIRGLRLASIWSEDLNRLLPFYRDMLGLPVGMESPAFVILGDPEQPALALGTHNEVHGTNRDPARHMVALDTDDVHREFERLRGVGVEFVEPPTDYGDLLIATMKDPDGNLVQLYEFKRV